MSLTLTVMIKHALNSCCSLNYGQQISFKKSFHSLCYYFSGMKEWGKGAATVSYWMKSCRQQAAQLQLFSKVTNF